MPARSSAVHARRTRSRSLHRHVLYGALAALFSIADPAGAQDAGRIPIGIVNADFLKSESFGIAYRFTREPHDGYRDGRNGMTDSAVVAEGYSILSDGRDDERHTLGLRYSPHLRLTFFVDVPWIVSRTKYVNSIGDSHVEVDELGDVTFGANVRFMKNRDEELYLGLATSAPTGDYHEAGRLGADSPKVRLPYPMQPGSGTWALIPMATYIGQYERTSWGAQYRGVFWLERNDDDYHPGHRVELSAWIAQGFGDWFVASMRLAYSSWGNYTGSDASMDYTQIPSADSKRQKGRRVDLGPGIQIAVPGLARSRLSAEILWPVYQDLDGPQLETDAVLHAGWRWAF